MGGEAFGEGFGEGVGEARGEAEGLGGGPSRTGLIVHAEADLRVIKDGGDNVSDWGQTGSGLAQLLQALGAKQAKWFADIDGRPAILLDGLDDFWKSSSAVTIGSTFSLFVGLRTLDPDAARVLVELSVGSALNNSFFFTTRGGVNAPTISVREQIGDVNSGKQADDSAWCVGTFQRALFEYGGTHATTKLFTDDTEEPTTTRSPGVSDEDPDPSTTDDLYVGSRGGISLDSNTYLRYLLLYSPILVGADLAQTSSYLAGKWGLGIAGLDNIIQWKRADQDVTTPVANNVGLWGTAGTQDDQADDAKRPKLVADPGDGNGPAVLYDGVDNFHASASTITVQGTYVHWLLYSNLSAASAMMYEHNTNVSLNGHQLFLDAAVDGRPSIKVGRSGVTRKDASAEETEFFDASWLLVRVERGTGIANFKLFANNVEITMSTLSDVAASTATTQTLYSCSRAGTSLFANIYKREELLISPIADAATIAGAEAEIRDRWNVY